MYKETIKRLITEFHEDGVPSMVERDKDIPKFKKINKVITIIGPRRAGKTYFLFQIIKEIIKTNPISDILYLNFDDERIKDMKTENLREIIDAYNELYPKKKPYVFLDEVQEITDWEFFVRRLHNQNYKIFITGSNSKMLGSEIATQLRGRTHTIEIFTFSFREFLKCKKIDLNKNWLYSQKKFEVKKAFNEYLKLSGYPECVLENTLLIINDYFKTVVFRDLVERFHIIEIDNLEFIMKYLINNYSNLFSMYRLYNFSKSNKMDIGMGSIQKYIGALEQVFFSIIVKKYQKSLKKSMQSPSKNFIIDHGYINYFNVPIDNGRLIENLVAIELRRRKKGFGYHSEKNECDFIISAENKIKTGIQVTWEINEKNKRREINGLLEVLEKYNLNTGIIITNDQEDEIKIGKKILKVIPIWKWLLE